MSSPSPEGMIVPKRKRRIVSSSPVEPSDNEDGIVKKKSAVDLRAASGRKDSPIFVSSSSPAALDIDAISVDPPSPTFSQKTDTEEPADPYHIQMEALSSELSQLSFVSNAEDTKIQHPQQPERRESDSSEDEMDIDWEGGHEISRVQSEVQKPKSPETSAKSSPLTSLVDFSDDDHPASPTPVIPSNVQMGEARFLATPQKKTAGLSVLSPTSAFFADWEVTPEVIKRKGLWASLPTASESTEGQHELATPTKIGGQSLVLSDAPFSDWEVTPGVIARKGIWQPDKLSGVTTDASPFSGYLPLLDVNDDEDDNEADDDEPLEEEEAMSKEDRMRREEKLDEEELDELEAQIVQLEKWDQSVSRRKALAMKKSSDEEVDQWMLNYLVRNWKYIGVAELKLTEKCIPYIRRILAKSSSQQFKIDRQGLLQKSYRFAGSFRNVLLVPIRSIVLKDESLQVSLDEMRGTYQWIQQPFDMVIALLFRKVSHSIKSAFTSAAELPEATFIDYKTFVADLLPGNSAHVSGLYIRYLKPSTTRLSYGAYVGRARDIAMRQGGHRHKGVNHLVRDIVSVEPRCEWECKVLLHFGWSGISEVPTPVVAAMETLMTAALGCTECARPLQVNIVDWNRFNVQQWSEVKARIFDIASSDLDLSNLEKCIEEVYIHLYSMAKIPTLTVPTPITAEVVWKRILEAIIQRYPSIPLRLMVKAVFSTELELQFANEQLIRHIGNLRRLYPIPKSATGMENNKDRTIWN
ncbi:uncharacterized protein I303_102209 [Kwoniella dejecticola CBS 10117]|uniref:Uncharacterized protein n=1 Tax=Kwoniella dejecticola CBS 10117 TaxID=1296121 RepID=A0AAJ8KLA7_9TREE